MQPAEKRVRDLQAVQALGCRLAVAESRQRNPKGMSRPSELDLQARAQPNSQRLVQN
jgi:hypothetical protein